MSRQQFSSRNNIGQVLTFQKSGSTASFDPLITFSGGSRRVSWRLDNGSEIKQTAGNSITYTGFTSDNGIRNIEIKCCSLKNMNNFQLTNDNLYGNLDLTPLSELSGNFDVSSNIRLTGITHGPSTNNFYSYFVGSCNLTGNLDLTPLSGLGGELHVSLNPNLTSITLPNTTNGFNYIVIDGNNLTGTLDLTPITNFTAPGGFSFVLNPSLTNIIFPISNGDFSNTNAFMNDCDLNYVDMTPLSGANFDNSIIWFFNNNMITSDVNHILVDFSGNATYNSAGWSNITLEINGTNAAPDSSSGGYNGLAAITFLTNSPYNWTITHT